MGNYHEHWFFGFAVTLGVLAAMYFIFHINVISLNIITWSVMATIIFSILPDIDQKSSYISGALHITTAIAIFALLTQTIRFNFASVLMLFSIAGLELYHRRYAKDSKFHRQFPHTFTFGIFSSFVFFLVSPFWIAAAIALSAFISHLLLDWHIASAIEKDKNFWKSKVLRIK